VAREASGNQMYEPPTKPLPSTLTVFRAPGFPFFSVIVTAPEAPDQVMLNPLPTAMPPKDGSVKITAATWLTAKAAAAKRTFENCILI